MSAVAAAVVPSGMLDRVGRLPSLSEAVLDMLECCASETAGPAELARKLARDQALSASALRLANSPFFGLRGSVATLEEAIKVLGFSSVRSLVTMAAVTSSLPLAQSGFDQIAFWRHGMATAAGARWLATSEQERDHASIAGLLHDLGHLALASCHPDDYRQIRSLAVLHDCDLVEAEIMHLGFDHAGMGGALAVRWNFAAPICEAIALHHTPARATGGNLAAVIHVADAVAHALDAGDLEGQPVPQIDDAAWHLVVGEHTALDPLFREMERACASSRNNA